VESGNAVGAAGAGAARVPTLALLAQDDLVPIRLISVARKRHQVDQEALHERQAIVLKFGGSVLREESDVDAAVHEIYRFLREGYRVVAVCQRGRG